MKTRAQQIRIMTAKQKKLYNQATTDYERFCLSGFWSSYLSGLRMTNAISNQEYQQLYREMQQYTQGTSKVG